MRIIAIIFNVILLIVIFVMAAKEGFPKPNDKEFLIILLIILTPTVNLLALLFGQSESWLSLYFRRKAIEEKARIAKLNREINSKQKGPNDTQ